MNPEAVRAPSCYLVAVVDDDAAVRKALVRALRAAGLEACAYPSGQALLNAWPTVLPDCVLLDLILPGLTGLDVQRRLQAAGSDPPVIIMTACEDSQMRLRCIEAGAAGFLRKPLDRVALIDVIEYAVQRRRIMASHESRHSHG